MRGRGILRYGALVEATERLLLNNSPDAVGLYQIAEEAGVPPASVYHFFPTKEAAFLALARTYLDEFIRLGEGPVPIAELHSWQDLIRIDMGRGKDFYNDHPPAMKILYGGYGGVETREVDSLYNLRIAESLSRRLNTVFHMPISRNTVSMFENCLAIIDGIWTISYRRYGTITDEYYNEALKACNAYCRLYLPETVELREDYHSAAERGEILALTTSEESEYGARKRRVARTGQASRAKQAPQD